MVVSLGNRFISFLYDAVGGHVTKLIRHFRIVMAIFGRRCAHVTEHFQAFSTFTNARQLFAVLLPLCNFIRDFAATLPLSIYLVP